MNQRSRLTITTLFACALWALCSVFTVFGAAALWYVFVYLLHIAQPEGMLPDLIERLRA